ncbi:ribosome maturation factor RimM [Arenimonas caeni]|jgi:16S rRNA processing protein RimM|uniref:Ribosome maturation factor RimM n=1 Tax=Arenimonas caeni TaxID=2058085 RepID=A0A2P6MCA6_9GAMM|nr:ribosome maturation factor RimM [Arenimonas caeni]MDY0021045.1 ribosome maturation factor RimM [Arenimonas caeni]PRH83617.1 ribosome maturation factor RimM [Arenimonas caeni]
MSNGRRILLGRVAGAFGVRGELKLLSWTDPRDALFRYQPWILRSGNTEREVTGVRGRDTGKVVIATFPGVESRDQAEAMNGTEIWVPRERLPPPGPGEYYWVDLEGLKVETTEGVALGQVSHLFETGANDVMVVAGERERLIPFVTGQYIVSVDFDAGKVVVDWDPDF